MVDLTRDEHGKVHARLLDLVPGQSGKAYADWLTERHTEFRKNVQIAILDPFRGYKNAIDDKLEDALALLDAFHVVKLGSRAVDEVRRGVQQDPLGRRGHTGDPLHGIRNILRCGRENRGQQLRDAYVHHDLRKGRAVANKVFAADLPDPRDPRLDRTIRQRKAALLASFDTDHASNGGTEAAADVLGEIPAFRVRQERSLASRSQEGRARNFASTPTKPDRSKKSEIILRR